MFSSRLPSWYYELGHFIDIVEWLGYCSFWFALGEAAVGGNDIFT